VDTLRIKTGHPGSDCFELFNVEQLVVPPEAQFGKAVGHGIKPDVKDITWNNQNLRFGSRL
jgi:hypothetical protein